MARSRSASKAIGQLLEAGMTKSELASRSGVSRALIDDYLKGRRQPSLGQLERLGRAASRQLTVTWADLDPEPAPWWARPNPVMAAPPTTVVERAQILERVTAAAAALPRQSPGELLFPSFRTVRSRATR